MRVFRLLPLALALAACADNNENRDGAGSFDATPLDLSTRDADETYRNNDRAGGNNDAIGDHDINDMPPHTAAARDMNDHEQGAAPTAEDTNYRLGGRERQGDADMSADRDEYQVRRTGYGPTGVSAPGTTGGTYGAESNPPGGNVDNTTGKDATATGTSGLSTRTDGSFGASGGVEAKNGIAMLHDPQGGKPGGVVRFVESGEGVRITGELSGAKQDATVKIANDGDCSADAARSALTGTAPDATSPATIGDPGAATGGAAGGGITAQRGAPSDATTPNQGSMGASADGLSLQVKGGKLDHTLPDQQLDGLIGHAVVIGDGKAQGQLWCGVIGIDR